MSRIASISSSMYTALLFAPFGFWILGVVIAFKAMKSGDMGQFKREIKAMFYHKSVNN